MSQNPLLTLADRLRAGTPAFAAWSNMKDPAASECMLRDGFDCAILDWQHGFHDFATIQAAIATAASCGKASLVRIGVGQFAEAARMLDWGAAGIIAPMINSATDARELVKYLKYLPLGERSWGPVRALNMSELPAPDFLRQANRSTIVIAMIETRAALEAVDEILAVDGIDGVLVGPSDLSIALFNGATVDPFSPEVDAAYTRIGEAAKKAGKIASAFCMNGDVAGALTKRGYALVSVATDQILLRMAARSELAKAKAILGA